MSRESVRKCKWLLYSLLIAGLGINAGIGSAAAQGTNPLRGKPIKIGLMAPLTGVDAEPGIDMLHGFKIFLKEHGNELDGRPVKLIPKDTQGKPAIALSDLRDLTLNQHVDVLVGPILASSGHAVIKYVDAHHLPTIFAIPSGESATQKDMSRWVIRTGWTSSEITQPFGNYAYTKLGYRRIATIGPAYAFGYGIIAGFRQTFQQAGGKIVAEVWNPIGQQDFSPYISRLLASHPDAVFMVGVGADNVRFLKQWRSMGIKVPLLAAGNVTDWSALPGEGNSALGVITALQYSASLKNPVNQRFVHDYQKGYHHPPSYYAEEAYTSGLFIRKALHAIGGDIEDKPAFLNALLQAKVNAPKGPVRLGPWQNPIENVYIMKVVKHDGHLENKVIYTYDHVSQFWKYNPAWFLSRPTYSKDFPPCTACGK